MLYRYHVYGLTLESELECPELAPAPAEAAVDVRIRVGHVEPVLEAPTFVGRRMQMAPGIFQLWADGVARYRVDRGRQILVDPVPAADPGDIRGYLLGNVLGITVLLNGLHPLHASAVRVNGQAYAFCGDSGAGKSTLAAALCRRGFTLITDDLAATKPEQECMMLYPGFPRIKLWRSALEYFGMNPDALVNDLTRIDKFQWYVKGGYSDGPLPLRRLYVLSKSQDANTLIEPLRGYAAISMLSKHTYGFNCLPWLGLRSQNLMVCAKALQKFEIYRFHRPFLLDHYELSLDMLIDHING